YDTMAGSWTWERARIERVDVTENVADFLASTLRTLPAATQSALRVAACIGHRFSLGLVSAVLGESVELTAAQLWPALREGLLVTLELLPGATSLGPWYQFAHDRVQTAAYSLQGELERKQLHLQVGRRLAESLGDDDQTDRIFEVVDQLNLGAELVTDEQERFRLAEL